MKTIILYALLCSHSRYDFEEKANDLCKMGYKPQGNISINVDSWAAAWCAQTYCQSFIKETKEKK